MSDPLSEYRTLLTELLFEREAAGGELPEEEESSYVARLDAIWWRLTPDEQTQMDEELARSPAQTVREEPSLVDCEVSEGSGGVPRRAA